MDLYDFSIRKTGLPEEIVGTSRCVEAVSRRQQHKESHERIWVVIWMCMRMKTLFALLACGLLQTNLPSPLFPSIFQPWPVNEVMGSSCLCLPGPETSPPSHLAFLRGLWGLCWQGLQGLLFTYWTLSQLRWPLLYCLSAWKALLYFAKRDVNLLVFCLVCTFPI